MESRFLMLLLGCSEICLCSFMFVFVPHTYKYNKNDSRGGKKMLHGTTHTQKNVLSVALTHISDDVKSISTTVSSLCLASLHKLSESAA